MKKLVVILLLTFWSSLALADPVVQAIPPGEDKIVPLKKGDPAPFSGQLFDTNTAIRWGNWLEQYKLRLALDTAYEKKLGQVELDLCQKKAQVDREAAQRAIEDLKKRLSEVEQKSQEQPWYKSNTLHFTLGAATMAGVVALTAWAVSASSSR